MLPARLLAGGVLCLRYYKLTLVIIVSICILCADKYLALCQLNVANKKNK